MTIRAVEERDVDAVVGLVHELAEYERAAEHCLAHARPAARRPVRARTRALRARGAEVAGQVVGCALWFLNFSTWRGVHGLYLEDLYVQPAHRGAGIGQALLAGSPASVRSGGSLAWSGRCSTGTSPRSASTACWAPSRWTSGRCSGSTARRWSRWPATG